MVEALQRLLKEILDALLAWVRKLSLGARLLVLSTAVLAILTVAHPESFLHYSQKTAQLGRVAFHSGEVPPLSEAAQSNLGELTRALESELARVLRTRADGRSPARFNHWALAQSVIALGDDLPERSSVIEELAFYPQQGPLWREFGNSTHCHIAASAWCLIALAKLGASPPENELNALLDAQLSNGSWPLYVTEEAELRNAATYPTAMALLALLHWRDHLQGEGPRLKDAVEHGFEWLRTATGSSPGRWLDYPKIVERSDFVTLSALVLRVSVEYPDELSLFEERARDWLVRLPAPIPTHPYQREASVHVLDAPEGVELKDTVRHYLLPWMLIGAATSYSEGTLWERNRTLAALEQISTEAVDIQKRLNVAETPWVAAELLIALKEIQGDNVLSP